MWTKHELISASKGKDLTTKFLNDKKITGISIDTRSIEKNDLFIAIKGKNYDGHKFLEKAIQKEILSLPNFPSKKAPIGKDETNNIQIKTWGDPLKKENLKSHLEIGENLNLFDLSLIHI